MTKGIVARIQDMLDTIDELERATADKTFEDFQRDWLLRQAAERGVEIISEASRHLPEDLKAHHPYPRWRHVAGIGNVLRHEYHRVEDRIVWSVIQDELPSLKAHLEAMRAEVEHKP
ncbi:MAG: HepT-like ribonuclease domain-containing protein [Geminicoccaceae bacterium]